MAGESLDNDLVALFLRSLGESVYFTEVDLDKTEMKGEDDGLRLMSFRIRAVLTNPDSERGSRRGLGRRREDGNQRLNTGKNRQGPKASAVRSHGDPRGDRRADLCRVLLRFLSGFLPGTRSASRRRANLQRKLSEVRLIAGNIVAFETEIEGLEIKLKKALRQLPNEKQLEVLLTDISNLGKTLVWRFARFSARTRSFTISMPRFRLPFNSTESTTTSGSFSSSCPS